MLEEILVVEVFSIHRGLRRSPTRFDMVSNNQEVIREDVVKCQREVDG